MFAWTQSCIEINLDKKLANIDYQTYQKLISRNSGEWESHHSMITHQTTYPKLRDCCWTNKKEELIEWK